MLNQKIGLINFKNHYELSSLINIMHSNSDYTRYLLNETRGSYNVYLISIQLLILNKHLVLNRNFVLFMFYFYSFSDSLFLIQDIQVSYSISGLQNTLGQSLELSTENYTSIINTKKSGIFDQLNLLFNLTSKLESLKLMNFNLPCFIPSYTHQQTAFVYVPLFQSQPQFNYYVQLQPFQTFVPQNELIQQLPQVEIPELIQTRVEQPQQKETEISSSTSHQLAIIDVKTPQDKPLQIQEKKLKSSNHLNNQVQFEKESKNIQKNYAKAIASFVYKNKSFASKILDNQEVDEFIQLIKLIKNQIQNVSHISQYTNNQDFIKAFRILGNYFLRTKSNSYIFNSRILKKNSHLRHKKLIHHSLLRC